ncbi:MAG: DegT/DnrJ/EryC1/StrS family aminotransferase [Candidatus Heimdallarchaeaceae archaeon]
MKEKIPAILGGSPAFPKKIPIIRPNYDKFSETILKDFREIINSNMVSNVNNYVKKFEDKIAEYLKVNHVIAVNSCTIGMILTMQVLGLRKKEVIIPSFTFSATAHMLYWNDCVPVFVDIDPISWNIDVTKIEEKITKNTGAILAVHLYGNPANINKLKEIAEQYDIELLFDAAHSLGSKYKKKHVSNYGFIHSYSLSPTKLLSTIEGGFITTDSEEIAEKLKISRNYGNYPDYTCKIPGLNARMSELYAAVGLPMVDYMDEFVSNRNQFAQLYKNEIKNIPGIQFQEIEKDNTSAYKDFSIVIQEERFGLDRNLLSKALTLEGISTKFYFYPPIHQLEAYKKYHIEPLKTTEFISNNVLSLPIYNFMEQDVILKICKTISEIQCHSADIKEKLKRNKQNLSNQIQGI